MFESDRRGRLLSVILLLRLIAISGQIPSDRCDWARPASRVRGNRAFGQQGTLLMSSLRLPTGVRMTSGARPTPLRTASYFVFCHMLLITGRLHDLGGAPGGVFFPFMTVFWVSVEGTLCATLLGRVPLCMMGAGLRARRHFWPRAGARFNTCARKRVFLRFLPPKQPVGCAPGTRGLGCLEAVHACCPAGLFWRLRLCIGRVVFCWLLYISPWLGHARHLRRQASWCIAV